MRSEEWWKGRIKLYSAPIPSFYKKGLGRNHLFLQVFFLCIIFAVFPNFVCCYLWYSRWRKRLALRAGYMRGDRES